MDFKESDFEGKGPARSEGPPAKVALTPRKAAMPTAGAAAGGDAGLSLEKTGGEPIWKRRNRICPKSPKVPFETPPRTTEAPGAPTTPGYVPRYVSRRGIMAFFRSRRKGRTRILNFILLPVAITLAFLAIYALFKFH